MKLLKEREHLVDLRVDGKLTLKLFVASDVNFKWIERAVFCARRI
jgi:hypothetical protein